MTHFDEIYDIAVDNYGLVTAAQARGRGVTSVDLRRSRKNSWLDHRGNGEKG